MSYHTGQSRWHMEGRTHTQTDAGNDNTQRPKLGLGKKGPLFCLKGEACGAPKSWFLAGIFRESLRAESLSHKTSFVRSLKASKAQDWWLECSNCSESWQTSWQQCCWGTCQMSKQYEHSNTWYCAFQTLWDLTIRPPMQYWIGPMAPESFESFLSVPWAHYKSTLLLLFCWKFSLDTNLCGSDWWWVSNCSGNG